MASLLFLTGMVSRSGYALNAGDENTTAAVTAESSSQEITGTVIFDGEEEILIEKEEISYWDKHDISAYGDSMSLVSYKETTPEMFADSEENSGDNIGVEKKLTEAEVKAMIERRRELKKLSPSLTRKARNAEPTAVELFVSGKPVKNVPPSRNPWVEQVPGQFSFVTYGWGHGVGMSQNSANFYATYSGWTYQDILYHYYPGTYLMNTGTVDDERLTIKHEPAGDTLDVVSRIVFNEVGGGMAYEAIKAQAVAVYTYIKYNGDDSHDLRPKNNPPKRVVDACREVLGEALFYDEDYALTMFSASSGGCSANCYEVFYQDVPYLRSVVSEYDGGYDPHYGTVTYFTENEMREMIEDQYNIKLSKDPTKWIQPIYSKETGYITEILIDGQMYVKGYAFSQAMGLKSCKFEYTFTPASYVGEENSDRDDIFKIEKPDEIRDDSDILDTPQIITTAFVDDEPVETTTTETMSYPEETTTLPYEDNPSEEVTATTADSLDMPVETTTVSSDDGNLPLITTTALPDDIDDAKTTSVSEVVEPVVTAATESEENTEPATKKENAG